MNNLMSRRQFLASSAIIGGGAIAGVQLHGISIDALAERQIPQGSTLRDLPALDGQLLVDDATRLAIGTDYSNRFHGIPGAVLRPASVNDVVRIVKYANQHGLKVAVKGDGHSQYGQTQAAGGIAIDTRTLRRVASPSATSIDVQPGAYWADVAGATLPHDVTPRVYPATCMMLTVGGLLSVGGLGNTTQRHGAVADNVLELDVVTGDGRLVTCSPEREPRLFDMTLAGMGQCGVIVRARLPLIQAPPAVLIQNLNYTSLDAYVADQVTLARDGRYDHLRGTCLRKDGTWKFTTEVGKYFTPPQSPDMTALHSGLHFEAAEPQMRMSYRQNLFRLEVPNSALNAQTVKRAYVTMFIPASKVTEFAANILALPPAVAALPTQAGVERFAMYALNTARLRRPLFPQFGEEQVFVIWLFRSVPASDAARLAAVEDSNRQLLARMAALGGKRYGPYPGVVMSSQDWSVHFGAKTWQQLTQAKQQYDPSHVLSPGAGMFG